MIDRGLLNYPEQLAVRLSKMERDIKRNAGKSSNCSGGGIPGPKGDPGPAGPPNVLNIGTVVSGATASATITGTTPAQTLNLVLPKGDPGTPGTAATIAVGSTTTLTPGTAATVTNSGTSTAAVFDFGIPKGDKGDTGDPGAAATIAAGNVTTLPAGSSATVTNTGTSSAAIFEFGIPQGDKGDTGNPGAAATIAAGSTTTLPAGSSATVTNSGTSSAAVFDFGIPKGDTGAAGADGADGADGFSPIATVSKAGDTATISITDLNGTTTATITDGTDGAAATIAAGTTTTLSPGSSATVTNSGTSSAAVFDFGIPQGATGAPGADGADGADGFSPIATVSKVGDTATITITDENGTTTASVTDGSDGAPGAAATITAGTTTTLAPGSSATVTNSGTSSAAVFDFGIPTGATGPKGDPGNSGPIGSIFPYAGSTIPDGFLECNGAAVSRTIYADLFAVIGTTYGPGDGSTTFNLPDLRGKTPVGQNTSDTSFDVLGETGGSKTHTIASSELPTHTHSYDKSSTTSDSTALTSGQLPKMSGSFRVTDNVGRNGVYSAIQDASGMVSLAGWNHAMVNAAVASVVTGTVNDIVNIKFGNNEGHTHGISLASAVTGNGGFANSPISILQPYITIKYIIKFADDAINTSTVVNSHSTSTTDVYSASYVNGLASLTVNDGTLTIQKNGTTVQTFTANQATNATANITVPTSFGDLTGTVSSSQIDWSAFAMTTVGEVSTITPNGNVYTGDTYIQLEQNSNGRLFRVSGSLGWWNNSNWTTSGKTSLGNGYYGFKTTLKLTYHPSAVKIYPYCGISWNWVPGGADKVDGYGIMSDNKNMLGIAIGTDGTLYVGVNKSSSLSANAWWRIGVKYPGVTLAI